MKNRFSSIFTKYLWDFSFTSGRLRIFYSSVPNLGEFQGARLSLTIHFHIVCLLRNFQLCQNQVLPFPVWARDILLHGLFPPNQIVHAVESLVITQEANQSKLCQPLIDLLHWKFKITVNILFLEKGQFSSIEFSKCKFERKVSRIEHILFKFFQAR